MNADKPNVLSPTLHKPIPLQTRVVVPELYLGPNQKSYRGKVVGISSQHVIFTYIVSLDCAIQTEYGVTTAITVDGANLMDENGQYAWRLGSTCPAPLLDYVAHAPFEYLSEIYAALNDIVAAAYANSQSEFVAKLKDIALRLERSTAMDIPRNCKEDLQMYCISRMPLSFYSVEETEALCALQLELARFLNR